MLLPHPGKIRIALIASTIIISVGLLLGCAVKKMPELEYSELQFEKKKWVKAREEEEWSIRSGMAKNLINQKILSGKSRAEIIEILDSPEDSYTEGQKFYYLIRRDHDSNIDPVRIEYLVVTVDEKDKSSGVSIETYKK